MSGTSPETAAAATPGQAAYEAYVADITADVADITGTVPFSPWDQLDPRVRQAMEAGARDAIAVHGCPPGNALAQAAMAQLADENENLAGQLAALRDRIDSLALGIEASAATSRPSKKSEIEDGCASALRGLLRIDGESGEETRQRLERERTDRDQLRASLSTLTDRAEAGGVITEDEADEYRKLASASADGGGQDGQS